MTPDHKCENGVCCVDSFGLLDKLSEATKVSIPKGLQNLDKKEVRHTGVIEVADMPATVENLLK